jgi:hypothetical protein
MEGGGCGDVFFVFSAIRGKLGIMGVFQLWFALGFF